MAADGGLWLLQYGLELRHGELLLLEQQEQPATGDVGEGVHGVEDVAGFGGDIHQYIRI